MFALGIALTAAWPALAAAPVPASRTSMLDAAQALRARGERVRALGLCEDALARWPGDRDIQVLRIELLAELGAAGQALKLATAVQPPLAVAERARLEADAAAHRTRWSGAQPADPRHPYAEADAVVEQLERVDRYGQAAPRAVQQSRIDALIAYDQAGRGAEAERGYRALLREGGQLPPYAESAMADALLQRRRPEQAIPLFEDSIRRQPGPYPQDTSDPRFGLMYAYLEAGRPRDALRLIDHVAATEPTWVPAPGSAAREPGPHKTEAELNAALVRYYVGMLADAHRRLDAMVAQAPMNDTLWRELGNVERARGWPRRSEDSLATAHGIDPDDLHTRLGLVEDWRELDDFARVEPTLRSVEAVLPRDAQVQQGRLDWERQRGWQFDASYIQGKGSAPTFGDRDHEFQAELQGPLLDDHWRVYGIARWAGATLPGDADTRRERLGLGVRGYWRGLEAYVQALPGVGGDTRRDALEAGLRWFPSDHWIFSADWSNTGDIEVPLQANRAGITARTTDVSAQWRASESTAVTLTGSHGDFSDGNRRNGWQAALQQRLYTAPLLALDGGLEVGQSRNDRTDVPYYSPSCARWAMPTARLENTLFQRYERSWRQRIDLGAGVYDECRYGSGWIATAHYGQTYAPHGGLSFGWGLGWSSQPYDGRRENRVALDLTLHWGE